IDSTQAAVTLTNHLLEKSLKAVLIFNEPNNQNYTDISQIENHFENMNNLHGNKLLYETITACQAKKLISDEQAEKLNEYRQNLRNAFSHADSNKTFGETKKIVGIFNPFVHNEIQSKEVKVANFPFLQDTTQKQIADKECVTYFKYVDSVIKSITPNLFIK
ncbi:MAG: hypothetical protein KDD21_11690, partial [Bacteroidetes bacterium]|nr:hypothetical protein [Bacteroidota bacterium]